MTLNLIDRGDGRMEIACEHGVGHPSKAISEKAYGPSSWKSWMYVHGCDLCCDLAEWHLAELKILEQWHKEGEEE